MLLALNSYPNARKHTIHSSRTMVRNILHCDAHFYSPIHRIIFNLIFFSFFSNLQVRSGMDDQLLSRVE